MGISWKNREIKGKSKMNINIKQLNSQEPNFLQDLKNLTTFELSEDFQIENTVREIIQNVRNNGDSAVLSYTQKFDNLQNINNLSQLQITPTELDQAISKVPQEKLNAIKIAAERIKNFHQKQFEKLGGSWDFTENENILGQRIFPLQKVGLYVPGGKAAYPSSVLMNAIPAKVAGVKELIMVVPTPNGEKNAMVLAAAKIAGVDKIFTIGGAQAVAALAFGTQTIPKVAKIVGPGNAYVAAAKRQVFGVVGIDMIAGPSEILVIADDSANPDWVAIDLFSQAEHDELAQAILISPSENFIKKVQKSVENLIKNQPRKEIIATSLNNRGAFIKCSDLDEAVKIANEIAPEHLELSLEINTAKIYAEKICNAGAVFVGNYTSEALGDYCVGPNHVLPTSGSARFSSPLGVYDFVKRSSYVCIAESSSKYLGEIAATLADGEGLFAHKQSAEMRYKK